MCSFFMVYWASYSQCILSSQSLFFVELTHYCHWAQLSLHMQIKGLIPFILACDHPNANLYSFRILNNFSSSSKVRVAEIMTSSVEFSPRHTYYKWDGKAFSSNTSGFLINGTSLLGLSPRSSNGLLIKIMNLP